MAIEFSANENVAYARYNEGAVLEVILAIKLCYFIIIIGSVRVGNNYFYFIVTF